MAGIRHNPALTVLQQRELAGWFQPLTEVQSQFAPYKPLSLPQSYPNIDVEEGQTQYLITQRVTMDPIHKQFFLRVSSCLCFILYYTCERLLLSNVEAPYSISTVILKCCCQENLLAWL